MNSSTDIDLESEIVTEVRRIKRKLSERFGGDLHRMCEDARAHQAVSGRQIIDRSAARPRPQTVLAA